MTKKFEGFVPVANQQKIDRNGVIVRKFVGATDWSDPEIRNYLKSL